MTPILKLFLLSTALIISSCSSEETTSSSENTPDEDSIISLVNDYVKSINNADTTLASRIWENSDEISFITPRGQETGWDSIKTKFYINTMGSFFYNRRLMVHDVVVNTRTNTAWVTFNWDFKAKFRTDSSDFSSRGRESQTYLKEDKVWKLVQAHNSSLSTLRQGIAF